jgi:spermidine synthase
MADMRKPEIPRGREFGASAFAFIGSGCLLVLEIVAARLIAPALGVSLYTWTSVIGVVLAGVTLGNYIGGRLADRWPTRSMLALVYLAGSVATLLVLGVLYFMDSLELPRSAPAMLQVLWMTAMLFLLPSTTLAVPTPLLTRLSLHSLEHAGRVVGRIQAAAALGSIVATFLTGFFLISWFGTRHIVAGVAATLLLLAALAWTRWLPRHAYVAGPLAIVIIAAGWVSPHPCTRESSYYCIRVDPGIFTFIVHGKRVDVRPPFQTLHLDHMVHSMIDLTKPTELQYEYERQYASVIERFRSPSSRLDVFFIGGGGYVFPRWVEAKYSGDITAAEIDPEVTRVAHEYLDLSASTRMKVLSDDARRVLRTLPPETTFDAIFGDAFDDYAVPYHLTTRQFDELVASRLRPDGVYVLNVVDGVRHDFLRSKLRTLRLTFPYVGIVPSSSAWPPRARARDTYVIVAAKAPPSRPLPVIPIRSLDEFLARGKSVVLTDDYAPVEQLLAPVFSMQLKTGH